MEPAGDAEDQDGAGLLGLGVGLGRAGLADGGPVDLLRVLLGDGRQGRQEEGRHGRDPERKRCGLHARTVHQVAMNANPERAGRRPAQGGVEPDTAGPGIAEIPEHARIGAWRGLCLPRAMKWGGFV